MAFTVMVAGGSFVQSETAVAADRSAPEIDAEVYLKAVRSTVDCIHRTVAESDPVATQNSAGLFQIAINFSQESEQALLACKAEHLLAIELAYSSSIPFSVKKEATILQDALTYEPTRQGLIRPLD